MSKYQEIAQMLDANAIQNTVDAYNKGRADAEAEHKAMCESCIHKVSADDIKAIRADAIDEIYQLADERMKEQIKYLEQNTRRNGKMWAMYMNTYLGHIKVACKQLKGKKND